MMLKLSPLVKDFCETISNEPANSSKLQEVFHSVGDLLDIHVCNDLVKKFSLTNNEFILIKNNFIKYHYAKLLQTLIKKFDVEWISQLSRTQTGHMNLEDLFLKGPGDASSVPLVTLCQELHGQSCRGYRLQKTVSLLEKYLELGRLDLLVWSQCNLEMSISQSREDVTYQRQQWEQLLKYIGNLPEIVTNRLQSEAGSIFYPSQYIPLVGQAILFTSKQIQSCIEAGTDSRVDFASKLLGKVCLCGHADLLWNGLLPSWLKFTEESVVWCRVCELIICRVPERCMESVVISLVKVMPWYGYMARFLGHSVFENQKIKFLMTHKLLLLKHYKQNKILQNILGYLASSGTFKPLLLQTVCRLLEVWSDSSALKHTAYDQHLYITKALLVASAFLTNTDLQQVRNDALASVTSGIQIHLDSSLPQVRRQGMIVAEVFMERLNNQKEKLKFEYEEDAESKELQCLLVKPEDPGIEALLVKFSQAELKQTVVTTKTTAREGHKLQSSGSRPKHGNIESVSQTELDSDDDEFAPYDLSNDVVKTKAKAPVYIRDCMEGLLSNKEDPDQFDTCLQTAERLIREHPVQAKEVAVEFTKVVLHLQDQFSSPTFIINRYKTLTALLVVYPEKVAEYMTGEFYDRNYNIRQRLDILEALTSAAKELSGPCTKPTGVPTGVPSTQVLKSHDQGTLSTNWRDVVQQRIESKTRRFASGSRSSQTTAFANRFASVAGEFFFPLVAHFDKKENTLDMLGADHFVLGRLVHTLGELTYYAQHAMVCKNMGKVLLEFAWVLRYHSQPSVRQSLLFAVCMVFYVVPSHAILHDLQTSVMETKSWLQDVVEHDSDHECQRMAIQALLLLENTLKNVGCV